MIGIGPLPALDQRARRLAGEQPRIRIDLALIAGPAIEARRGTIRCCRRHRRCRRSADRARCSRAPRRRDCTARARRRVRRRHRRPPRPPPPQVRVARHAHGAAVLLRAADVVRHVLGRDDVVVLRRRDVLRASSPWPLASRHRAAAVVADDEMLRIVGIDPQIVMIAVRAAADRWSASCRRRSSGNALTFSM